MITVHLPAQVRRKIGRRTVEIDLGPGHTLEDLLLLLSESTDSRFLDLVTQGTTGNPWVNSVVLNNRRVELPPDLKVELGDGDRVHFIHPIAGGEHRCQEDEGEQGHFVASCVRWRFEPISDLLQGRNWRPTTTRSAAGLGIREARICETDGG